MTQRPQFILKFSAALAFPFATLDAAVLVKLDATSLQVGALPTWANTGNLAGNFTSGATVPQVALTTPSAGGGSPGKEDH